MVGFVRKELRLFACVLYYGGEVHWFEAHGIGKKEMRIKRFLD